MITDLTNETKQLIAQNKSNEYKIADFKKQINKIETMLVAIKANEASYSREKLMALQIWLNEYQEYIEECEAILNELEINPAINENDCKKLLQYITVYNERQKELQINSPNVISQISNLHNILHNLNIYYQNLFGTTEILIDKTTLPNKKDDHYSLEEYLAYVQDFYRRQTYKDQISAEFQKEQELEEQFQKIASEPILPENPIKKINVPPFLQEYQEKYDQKQVLKRQENALLYQKKLQSLLTDETINPSLKALLEQELARVKNISAEEYANLKMNLHIPTPSISPDVILHNLKTGTPYYEETKLQEFPTISNPYQDLDIPSFIGKQGKKYTRVGKTTPTLTELIRKFGKTIGVACALALLTSQNDYDQVLGSDYMLNEYLNFDNIVDFGDSVNLKSQALCYSDGKVDKEEPSIKTIPLYNLDIPRKVEGLFLIKDQEIIEVHSSSERNYYLEKGYQVLSIKTFDGFYKSDDVKNIIKREMTRFGK